MMRMMDRPADDVVDSSAELKMMTVLLSDEHVG
jgi:hypothetical protein